jgi:hypothetical protein
MKPMFPLNITDLHIHQLWWGLQQTALVFDCGCWVNLYRDGNYFYERECSLKHGSAS